MNATNPAVALTILYFIKMKIIYFLIYLFSAIKSSIEIQSDAVSDTTEGK